MSPRERVQAACDRREPDKVPKTAGFTPAVLETFRRETGRDDPAAYFDIEMRGIGFRPAAEQPDFSEYYPEGVPDGARFTEYGTMHVPAHFWHFTGMRFPMTHLESVEELEAFPWPDFTAAYRHAHLEADAERLHAAGFWVNGSVGHIYETAWQMTGMERLLSDCILNLERSAYILDRIMEDRCFVARRVAEAGADMLSLGDDVGMQHKLMMHPDMWREWLKPRLAKVIRAGREVNPDIHVFYHSDGNIQDIIPDLIEVGVTVLNPIQPECMDPIRLKREYGDRLAFWGTIGTQTTMPFGTAEEVKATVREMCETVGEGGGLILAPTHVLEPDVPWENIVAFFEACEEYGRYW
ncbi:MAG: uroporphyrinogen decarboxylase family protein [Armatimonadota bacterium]